LIKSRLLKLAADSGLVRAVLLLLILSLTFLLYLPGISGPFLLDDYPTLVALGNQGGITDLDTFRQFVFGNTSGPTGRPVSMLSFLLDGQTWPVDAGAFKRTNILLHLGTGLLLGWFVLKLVLPRCATESQAGAVAFITLTLWLIHPLNVSTTLYIVQRMTQWMVFFSLAALVCYLYGREFIDKSRGRGLVLLLASLFPFGLLAVLSKENGVLLLAAIVVVEKTAFSTQVQSNLYKWWLRLGVYLPLLITVLFLAVNFQSMTADYAYRPFTLLERLLTEARVLWIYLFSIFLPQSESISLFHDDLTISTGIFTPFSTLFAVVGIGGLAFIAYLIKQRQPFLSLAIFWFLIWHLLESTYLPLEPYFEHRNYVAMVGPLIALVYYIVKVINFVDKRSLSLVVSAGMLCLFIYYGGSTLRVTTTWGDPLVLYNSWVENQPNSIRANMAYSEILASQGAAEEGFAYLDTAQKLAPEEVTLNLALWNYACENTLPPTLKLEEISSANGLQHYRDDVNYHLQVLLENLLEGKCQYPGQEDIMALLDRLEKIPMRPYDRANFHMLYADFFIYYRQLNPALVQLRNAYDIRGDAAIPIRQAILAASAGNYEDSLVFLGRAREADENRNPLLASRISEISRMEQDLQQRLGI